MNVERGAHGAERKSRRRDRALPVAGLASLLALCSFLFFYRLADLDLWSSHEARAAMDAQGVLDGGGVLVPHLFGGQAELQKPPLYYWLVAAAARLGGGAVGAWSARLPAAASALGCVLGLAALGRWCGRARAGSLAAVVLATAAHFTWQHDGGALHLAGADRPHRHAADADHRRRRLRRVPGPAAG
jgi:4-amino-4-deoxy-L-arabinose transferase-like glycosyltransferase